MIITETVYVTTNFQNKQLGWKRLFCLWVSFIFPIYYPNQLSIVSTRNLTVSTFQWKISVNITLSRSLSTFLTKRHQYLDQFVRFSVWYREIKWPFRVLRVKFVCNAFWLVKNSCASHLVAQSRRNLEFPQNLQPTTKGKPPN